MEVSGLGVKSELQLKAYATASAMPDPSHICKLHTLPASKARGQTHILSHTSQILNLLSHHGNS